MAGAIGMASLRGRPLSWLHFFLVVILQTLAMFLVLHVTTRYLVQLLPLWIVFAAVVVYAGMMGVRDAAGCPCLPALLPVGAPGSGYRVGATAAVLIVL